MRKARSFPGAELPAKETSAAVKPVTTSLNTTVKLTPLPCSVASERIENDVMAAQVETRHRRSVETRGRR